MKIPYKIFGVALLVLVLMSTSIVYSTYKLYGVKNEVTALAHTFIPLTELLAEVDLQTTQQQLHLERLEKQVSRVKLIDEYLRQAQPNKIASLSSTGQGPSAGRRALLEQERAALDDKIATEEKMFLTRRNNVDLVINEAKGIIADASTNIASDQETITLITLSPLLQSIDQQHANLHAQMNLHDPCLQAG